MAIPISVQSICDWHKWTNHRLIYYSETCVSEPLSENPEVAVMMTPASYSSAPDSSFFSVHALRRAFRPLLMVLVAGLLFGCKIVVTVPEGGRVVTEDGFVCLAGDVCVIEVLTDTFNSTFTAKADAGYTFTQWALKSSSFCGHKTTPCPLSTTGFTDIPFLMKVLAGDREFNLEPIFVAYDVEYWRQVLREIDEGSFSTDSYLYAIKPAVGNCDPGSLKAGPKARAAEALEQTRALHELPLVDYDSSWDMQMQETSLVQRANNYPNGLNHTPSLGDTCYTQSAADGAGSSNLGFGSEPSDPAADIFGWTNDNNNLSNLMLAGHRRWILFPELGFTSYGQVENFTALKVFNFGMPSPYPVPANLEFVAMPYRYYPYVLVSKPPKPTPWSISMVPQGGASGSFNYFANATVEVIENATGNSLPIRNLTKDNQGFGLANFLSWLVDGWDYDIEYTVKVSNIQMPGGNVRNLEYPVVVDRYHLFNVDHPLETGDAQSGNTLQGNFNTADDKDSYRTTYKGLVNVSGTSEFSNMGFYVRIYDRDKRLLASSDQPFALTFPPGADTALISPCDENGLCYQGTQTYTVTFSPQ